MSSATGFRADAATAAACAAAVAGRVKPIRYELALWTNHAGSDSASAVRFASVKWNFSGDDPATIAAELVNTALDQDADTLQLLLALANERNADNRAQLAANGRLTAYIAALPEIKWDGRIFANRPGPAARLRIEGQDWACKYNEVEAACDREPDSIEVVAAGDTRRVVLLDMDGDGAGDDPDGVFSFAVDGSGTDPAFDEATQTVRRSLKPCGARLFRRADISDPLAQREVPPANNYQFDWASAALQILERNGMAILAAASGAGTLELAGNYAARFREFCEFEVVGGAHAGDHVCSDDASYAPATGRTTLYVAALPSSATGGVVNSIYYVGGDSGLRAYLESAATGAANCDFARVLEDLFGHPADDEHGGLGAVAGSGGPGYYSFPDTGIDLPGAFTFPADAGQAGLLADGIKAVQGYLGTNFKVWYDSAALQHTGGFMHQQPADSEDLELGPVSSVEQERSLAQLASRVIVTGLNAQPVMALANPAKAGLAEPVWTDETGGGTWQFFNGTDAAEPLTGGFGKAIALVYDGDPNMGALVTDLPGGSGANPYNSWRTIASCDLGAVVRIQRLRVRMLGSRNANSGSGHHGHFWPGVQVEVSVDGVNWFDIAPELSRVNYRPGELVDIGGAQVVHPRARYLRLTCCVYKFGERGESAGERGCGLAELDIFLQERYRIVRAIQDSDPAHFWPYSSSLRLPITAADPIGGSFTVAGNFAARITARDKLGIVRSASGLHNGVWTVGSAIYNAGETTVFVAEPVASSSATGVLITPIQPSYYPSLLARCGGVHRTLPPVDNGEALPASLAADQATQRLGESVRLFRRFAYSLPDDPRLRRYDTVTAPDVWNGGAGSILLDSGGLSIEPPAENGGFSPARTTCAGTNFLEDPLEATS